MAHGRRMVECIVCNKTKLHFGLDMCSSCLRHHKRQTRPSFYLGTCYSELKRRCTHKDIHPSRSYFGKRFCSKEEFISRFLTDESFLKQFKIWQDNNFQRGYAPSIDRIDNSGDYTLNNLEFIEHRINSKKDWQNPVTIYLGEKLIGEFDSQKDAAYFLNMTQPELSGLLNGKLENNTGYRIIRHA